MRDMVISDDYRHMTIRSLALHAQRTGKVFASPSTWSRLARERGWLRPRRGLLPGQPKQGIRANKPNDYWHIDLTIIKLLDGTRTYLHALLDNFSRRILAWKLTTRLEHKPPVRSLPRRRKISPRMVTVPLWSRTRASRMSIRRSTTFLVLDNCAVYSPRSRSAIPIP